MNFSLLICSVVLVLMLARWGVELWLRGLNRRHVLAHANAVPDAFKGSIDDATYARSVQYTLAKSKFSQIEDTYGLVQLLMAVLAPVLIMPLFNKFTPLPAGNLRERLLALARRIGFRAADIQVMDGSKRSRHSNAFFTGFGRFRKIVLFDTLIQQLAEPELEAVLAHEIGHYKKRHVPKMLAGSGAALLLGFFLLAILARQEWLYRAFGFSPGSIVPALLLFGLLSGLVTFWFSPLAH